MNRVNISVHTRNLPWRIWSCETTQSWVLRRRRTSGDGLRRFASISRAIEDRESFDIRCGSSGNITVDIYNSEALSSPLAPLVIYFPSVGAHCKDDQPPIPNFLSSLPFRATFAQVNYRWNIPPLPSVSSTTGNKTSSFVPLSSAPGYKNYPFPTPLHDTLFAYDFLTTNFLPTFLPQAHKSKTQRPIILAGTFLGGTLATSLALTSTYASLSKPQRIAGLITQNAIFDWSPIAVSKGDDEIATTEHSSFSHEWTPQTLHALKSQLFVSPQSAFDTFASPLLFFRTAGFVVPKRWAGEAAALALNDEVNRYSTSIDPSSPAYDDEVSWSYGDIPTSLATKPISNPETNTPIPEKEEPKADSTPEPARISHLKFPPTTSPTSSSSFSRYNNTNPNRDLLQLKIPRSLFLYSSSSSASSAHEDGMLDEKKKKKKSKKKSKLGDEDVTPEDQAKEMARVMRRSVLLVECKDRTMWDEGFDAHGAAEERVGVLNDQSEDVDARVRGWLEDSLE